MKIAVIDNYDSFVFNLVRYLKEQPNIDVSVMRNRQVNFAELETADGILLSPGPGIPDEAGDLLKIIDQFQNRKSIFGVCLGHQAIGQHFGFNLSKGNEIIHGKSTEIDIHDNCKLFDGLGNKLTVGRYHSWVVSPKTTTTSDIIVTAKSPKGEVMALRHKSLPIYGVQFHPESILTPQGRQILTNWTKTIV